MRFFQNFFLGLSVFFVATVAVFATGGAPNGYSNNGGLLIANVVIDEVSVPSNGDSTKTTLTRNPSARFWTAFNNAGGGYVLGSSYQASFMLWDSVNRARMASTCIWLSNRAGEDVAGYAATPTLTSSSANYPAIVELWSKMGCDTNATSTSGWDMRGRLTGTGAVPVLIRVYGTGLSLFGLQSPDAIRIRIRDQNNLVVKTSGTFIPASIFGGIVMSNNLTYSTLIPPIVIPSYRVEYSFNSRASFNSGAGNSGVSWCFFPGGDWEPIPRGTVDGSPGYVGASSPGVQLIISATQCSNSVTN